MARPNYVTVTLVTEDGIAFEGHAPTEAAARTKAYDLAKKKMGSRSVPKLADMTEHKRNNSAGPHPRSF